MLTVLERPQPVPPPNAPSQPEGPPQETPPRPTPPVPTPPAGPEKIRSGSSLCALEWAKTGSLRQLPLAGGYL
jgi:hypothetical protein